jgi:MFS superfamily sulfate permease-like transporter
LANLGSFLPYSVLCGFFSAVGVLLWALAFSVDTSGKTWQSVFFSGDGHSIWIALLHHLPSLIVGILMHIMGPKHPFYVILLLILTVLGFYSVMWATGTSLEEAQEDQWFWSRHELVYEGEPEYGFDKWAPPAPLGVWPVLFNGKVNWKAVQAGLGRKYDRETYSLARWFESLCGL